MPLQLISRCEVDESKGDVYLTLLDGSNKGSLSVESWEAVEALRAAETQKE